ncbi:RBBP9/YdeN family alpha/beta hydrolase [Larkinella insperata]|uniref:RBBP9/YdeN family alpha/beta hydrolase n=1 Tax=Larkinella insperata TaxID=332158 RepID=A0ABW3QBX0_9BACT|nr:alpha/beta fold hydrolase [Larkinella insperata]
MKKQVLFIHCAGPQGPHTGSDNLVSDLRQRLGAQYRVRYPQMPNPDAPHYTPWKKRLEAELAATDGTVVLVGHSLGGSVILKYLAEENPANPIAGVCVVAAPYWGKKGWKSRDFTLPKNLSTLSLIPQIIFFHSHDDEVVPFFHAIRYAELLPDVRVCALEHLGHLFTEGCAELAHEIRRLSEKPRRRKRFKTPLSQGA